MATKNTKRIKRVNGTIELGTVDCKEWGEVKQRFFDKLRMTEGVRERKDWFVLERVSGFWILDSGFWILDSGFWILDLATIILNSKNYYW